MKKLASEMDGFRKRLVDMGNLTEKMVRQVAEALSTPNPTQLITSIRQTEERVDQFQLDIDREAIRLLTVYSPVASDLRAIMSISRITTELERIGDHTINVSESLELVQSDKSTEILPTIQRMAGVVVTMVRDALDAFTRSDVDMARSTIGNDNIVDAMNDQVVNELLSVETLREVVAGNEEIAGVLAQMLISRSLERIADQSTNICEEVVYMIKGDDIRHQSLRGGHA